MKLSFTSVSIGKGLDLNRCIDYAVKSGCAGIEFRTGGNFEHGIELTLTEEQRKEVRRKFEDRYLEVSCLNTKYQFHYTDIEERRKNIEGAKNEVKLAYDLGCKRIRVFGNVIPDGINAQECVSYVSDAVAEVADYALQFGIEVLLEMHGQFNYWGYALAAVEKANRPNLGILYNSDKRDIVGGSIRETFNRVKKYVRHVHMHDICDAYPYDQLFEELVSMGYEGYVSAEISASSDPERVLCLHNRAVNLYIQLAKYATGKRR
jgi:sugar phosphate isomerase/epimerase